MPPGRRVQLGEGIQAGYLGPEPSYLGLEPAHPILLPVALGSQGQVGGQGGGPGHVALIVGAGHLWAQSQGAPHPAASAQRQAKHRGRRPARIVDQLQLAAAHHLAGEPLARRQVHSLAIVLPDQGHAPITLPTLVQQGQGAAMDGYNLAGLADQLACQAPQVRAFGRQQRRPGQQGQARLGPGVTASRHTRLPVFEANNGAQRSIASSFG